MYPYNISYQSEIYSKLTWTSNPLHEKNLVLWHFLKIVYDIVFIMKMLQEYIMNIKFYWKILQVY